MSVDTSTVSETLWFILTLSTLPQGWMVQKTLSLTQVIPKCQRLNACFLKNKVRASEFRAVNISFLSNATGCQHVTQRFYVFQDLLHISEYDLLELGVHNHLHRLHLLTSLRLLQERERRKGTLVHARVRSRPNMIFSYLLNQLLWFRRVFVGVSVFSCLCPCCGDPIAWLSCEDMSMPGGGLVCGGGLSGGGQCWHTHTQTFEHF